MTTAAPTAVDRDAPATPPKQATRPLAADTPTKTPHHALSRPRSVIKPRSAGRPVSHQQGRLPTRADSNSQDEQHSTGSSWFPDQSSEVDRIKPLSRFSSAASPIGAKQIDFSSPHEIWPELVLSNGEYKAVSPEYLRQLQQLKEENQVAPTEAHTCRCTDPLLCSG